LPFDNGLGETQFLSLTEWIHISSEDGELPISCETSRQSSLAALIDILKECLSGISAPDAPQAKARLACRRSPFRTTWAQASRRVDIFQQIEAVIGAAGDDSANPAGTCSSVSGAYRLRTNDGGALDAPAG